MVEKLNFIFHDEWKHEKLHLQLYVVIQNETCCLNSFQFLKVRKSKTYLTILIDKAFIPDMVSVFALK